MATQCTATQLPFHPFGPWWRDSTPGMERRRSPFAAGGGPSVGFDAPDRGVFPSNTACRSWWRNGCTGWRGYEDLNDHAGCGRIRCWRWRRARRTRAVWSGLGRGTGGMPWPGRAVEPAGVGGAEGAREALALQQDADGDALDRLLVKLFLESHGRAPETVWLDLDATDDPLHGAQEGRFFHGYYKSYCYLPLYIFSGEHLLCARLRPSNIDAAEGSVQELKRIIGRIRQRFPAVRIVVRGDSGFCRDEIMDWCERNGVNGRHYTGFPGGISGVTVNGATTIDRAAGPPATARLGDGGRRRLLVSGKYRRVQYPARTCP